MQIRHIARNTNDLVLFQQVNYYGTVITLLFEVSLTSVLMSFVSIIIIIISLV